MSKSIKANDFMFDYQYDQEKRQMRKQQRQSRQLRQGKHSRFEFLDKDQDQR